MSDTINYRSAWLKASAPRTLNGIVLRLAVWVRLSSVLSMIVYHFLLDDLWCIKPSLAMPVTGLTAQQFSFGYFERGSAHTLELWFIHPLKDNRRRAMEKKLVYIVYSCYTGDFGPWGGYFYFVFVWRVLTWTWTWYQIIGQVWWVVKALRK